MTETKQKPDLVDKIVLGFIALNVAGGFTVHGLKWYDWFQDLKPKKQYEYINPFGEEGKQSYIIKQGNKKVDLRNIAITLLRSNYRQ
ncbi:hypothetical protein HYX19_04885 [Candidatus Woesearchaeota archaeon]|nr:hypothetical protein [Candidatus Woesearchaeota archaeon]